MNSNQALVPMNDKDRIIQTIERSSIQLFDKKGEHELVELTFRPPVHTVYAIGDKADVLSEVYDLLAREMGISFGNLTVVEETESVAAIELSAGYYNRSGQPITDRVRVRIDVDLLFQESRLKWEPPVKWVTKTKSDGTTYQSKQVDQDALKKLQASGYLLDEVVYDERMVPIGIKRKLPPEVEAEKYTEFITLLKNKLQKAQTVARRTLTKRALGFKGVPVKTKDKDGKWKENLCISLYSIQPKLGQMHAEQVVNDVYGKDATDDQNEKVIKEPEDNGEPEKFKPAPKATPKTETPSTPPPAASADGSSVCSDCGESVPQRILEISTKKFNCCLCYKCMNTREAAKGGDPA